MTKTEMNTLEGIKDLQEADKLYFSYKPIIIGGATWCCYRRSSGCRSRCKKMGNLDRWNRYFFG